MKLLYGTIITREMPQRVVTREMITHTVDGVDIKLTIDNDSALLDAYHLAKIAYLFRGCIIVEHWYAVDRKNGNHTLIAVRNRYATYTESPMIVHGGLNTIRQRKGLPSILPAEYTFVMEFLNQRDITKRLSDIRTALLVDGGHTLVPEYGLSRGEIVPVGESIYPQLAMNLSGWEGMTGYEISRTILNALSELTMDTIDSIVSLHGDGRPVAIVTDEDELEGIVGVYPPDPDNLIAYYHNVNDDGVAPLLNMLQTLACEPSFSITMVGDAVSTLEVAKYRQWIGCPTIEASPQLLEQIKRACTSLCQLPVCQGKELSWVCLTLLYDDTVIIDLNFSGETVRFVYDLLYLSLFGSNTAIASSEIMGSLSDNRNWV